MQQAGHGSGQSPTERQSGVDILIQREAEEAGEDEGPGHRDREHQHIAQRDAERSTLQMSVHRRVDQLHRRRPEAEIPERDDYPGDDAEPTQHAVGAPLEKRAVALDHPEGAQRTHAEGERHQGTGDPESPVQHQRQVAGSQDTRAEEQAQGHVSRGAGREGDDKHGEHHASDEAQCALPTRDRAGRPLAPPRHEPPPQHHHPRGHLEQEDLLLQQRDDRSKVADDFGQEERADHVLHAHEHRIEREPRDPEGGEQHHDLAQGRDRAHRCGQVDPA